MRLEKDPVSLWKFVDAMVPEILMAGQWMKLHASNVESNQKADFPDEVRSYINSTVTDVDFLVQEMLLARCLEHFDNVIPYGEESTKHNERFTEPGVGDLMLTVDPLDGTYAYQQGKQDYCSMLCLFDLQTIHVSIIHFPALGQIYLGIVGEGVFVARCEGDVSNPFLINSLEFKSLTITSSNQMMLAVHYRFLKPPYDGLSQKLRGIGFEFVTLFGDEESTARASHLKGSNGSLIIDLLFGNSSAFIAPFVTFHDIFPLMGMVLAAGGSEMCFEIGDDLPWQETDLRTAIRALISAHKRTRVVLSLDENLMKSLAQTLMDK